MNDPSDLPWTQGARVTLERMSGFRVRLDALRDASDGIDGLLVNVRDVPLRAGAVGAGTAGDERLAAALGEFLSRWQTGVDLLVRDGAAVAGALRDSVTAYEKADVAAARDLVAGPGPDPAAGR